MADKKLVEFTGTVVRKVWSDDASGFRIYAVDVDPDEINKNNLKRTKYGNVCISGSIHELGDGLDYHIKAEETNGKNGYTYKVSNITRDRPKSDEEMYLFLQEILTSKEAKTMWEAYPDIVQRVIDNRLDDIDLNKTCGIKEYRFEVIKRKIIENYALAELVIEFKGLISMALINKIYNKYSSVQMVRIKLKEDPYKCLCGLSGIGFKKADAIALELEQEGIVNFGYELRTSQQRCLSAVIYLLQENESSGNTRMDLRELRQQIIKLVPAAANKFVDALKDYHIYYDKDKMVVALAKTYETEKHIADAILDAIKIHNDWDIDTSKYSVIDGCNLNSEQLMVNKLLCHNQIVILNGAGGTGKSFSTKSVIDLCKDNNKTYLPLSSTGKAAKVLSDYLGEEAKTIHRGLGFPCQDPNSNGWAFNQDNKLWQDLVIIDEFSMTDVALFEHVIDAIDFNRTKLLIVGDNAQASSVGAGNLLHDFICSKIIPVASLTIVHRYGEGGLMTVATDVRNSKQYLNKNLGFMTCFGKNKDYTFFNVQDKDIIKNVLALYKKVFSEEFQEKHNIHLDVTDVQVLTEKNVGSFGTVLLNNELQKIANKNYGSSTLFKVGETTFYENDIVMATQNNYKAEVYIGDNYTFEDDYNDQRKVFIANGETARVVKINMKEQYLVLDFNGVMVKYYRNDMQNVSLAYSCTIHKSQGSSIKIPIIITPRANCFMSSNNLLYVALTRTKTMCFHFSQIDTISMCIKKKENLKRDTFMQDLLKL